LKLNKAFAAARSSEPRAGWMVLSQMAALDPPEAMRSWLQITEESGG